MIVIPVSSRFMDETDLLNANAVLMTPPPSETLAVDQQRACLALVGTGLAARSAALRVPLLVRAISACDVAHANFPPTARIRIEADKAAARSCRRTTTRRHWPQFKGGRRIRRSQWSGVHTKE
jgi:hypothetical protein